MKEAVMKRERILRFCFLANLFALSVHSQQMITPESGNFVVNNEFDTGRNSWVLKKYNRADATWGISADSLLSGKNSMVIRCRKGATQVADIQFNSTISYYLKGCYTLDFMAMSSVNHTIRLQIEETYLQRGVVWESPDIQLTPEPAHYGPYTYRHRIENGGYRIKFLLGGQDGVDVILDSVSAVMTMDPEDSLFGERFIGRYHTFEETTMPYHLYVPQPLETSATYPIVLAIHGGFQDGWILEHSHIYFRSAAVWADSANQAKWPCFILAPHYLPGMSWWNMDWINAHSGRYSPDETPMTGALATVSDMLDSLIGEFPVDTNRIYVTGYSDGGSATWDLISRFPHRFAAAVPMAGINDSSQVHKLLHLPVWNFHGQLDETIPVEFSRWMARAFETAGRRVVYTHSRDGVPVVDPDSLMNEELAKGATLLYTEYPGGKHGNCIDGYGLPQLLPWVFSQSKDKQSGVAGRSSDGSEMKFSLFQNYPNPFNASTTIRFVIPRKQRVTLKVFDLLGREAATLEDGILPAGGHSAAFDASGLASGVYVARLESGGFTDRKKVVVIK
jgi:predicted peptidase